MVELTYGGAWFKWSSLSRRDRGWAMLSLAASFLAAVPIGITVGRWGYVVGFRAGSGGQEPPVSRAAEFLATDQFSYLILASTLLAIVSAFAWWRFSRNQDEMFNRIQNYALGQGSAWTFAILFLWWQLSLGGWVGTVPLAGVVGIGLVLITGFWFRASRRWL